MSGTFYIKRNDTSPAILYQLDPAVSLGNATVVFNMRAADAKPADPNTIARGTGYVHSLDPPVVGYEWQEGDTDVSGTFKAEFEVTNIDGSVESWPNRKYITVKIEDDLG